MTHGNQTIAKLILALILVGTSGAQTTPRSTGLKNGDVLSRSFLQPAAWESPARFAPCMIGGAAGTLRADSQGIEFVPRKGASMR